MLVQRGEIKLACVCGPFIVNGNVYPRPPFRHLITTCPDYRRTWSLPPKDPKVGDLVDVHGSLAVVTEIVAGTNYEVVMEP
jgi:hypothetical protein